WRVDSKPIWQDANLIADEAVEYGYKAEDAQKLIKRVAERLGISPEFVLPAYEDPWHYLMEEGRLPVNVDPFQKDLKDPEERSTWAQVLDQGLAEVVAYVLPVNPDRRSEVRWLSSRWPLKHQRLFLVPGDSPVGVRLPLSSLPWVPPDPGEMYHARDPFEPRQALAYPLIKTELDDPLASLRGQGLVGGQATDQVI